MPAAFSKGISSRQPSIKAGNGFVRITHCEYFANVSCASTAFEVTSYPLNPGIPNLFPWLAPVAARYETYKFRDVCFKYHTRSAVTQTGTVGLVFDFDAQDRAPQSQIEALTYRDKVADAVWKPDFAPLRIDLSQGDKMPSHYVRVGMPSSLVAFDLKTFDVGNLFVFTDGVTAATLGLIEVCYTVDLFTPQTQDPIGGQVTCSPVLDATHLFGVATPDAQAILPISFTSTSVATFQQPWEGVIGVQVSGTGLGVNYSLGISATGAASLLTSQIANAGTTESTSSWRVRAIRGTTLTPTITATTVIQVVYLFSSGGYSQFAV